jgi:hypothetical protein
MLRLERLKKYGPKSEKLSEEQVELLELEPGVHVQEVEKESGVSSGRKKLLKREHAGATPAGPSATARGNHHRGRRGAALRLLRRGTLPYRLRRKGSPRHGTGALLRASDQAREIGLPQMPGGGVVTAAEEAPRSWKRASSPTLWSSMCSSRNTSPICRSIGRRPICIEITRSKSLAARSMQPS